MKNSKNLSTQKIKETEENFFELGKGISNFKQYHPQDDFQHKNLRNLGNLFNKISFSQSIDEDYYKPIKTKSAFNENKKQKKTRKQKIKTKTYRVKNILI